MLCENALPFPSDLLISVIRTLQDPINSQAELSARAGGIAIHGLPGMATHCRRETPGKGGGVHGAGVSPSSNPHCLKKPEEPAATRFDMVTQPPPIVRISYRGIDSGPAGDDRWWLDSVTT